MTVLRIVPNLAHPDPAAGRAFWHDLLGLEPAMDLGWILTWSPPVSHLDEPEQRPQLSVMSQGGGGAPVPDLSIEVDDVDAVHARALEMGLTVERPLADEPWGVRRFFLREPGGRLVNILSHAAGPLPQP
ncbi:VOC family protein [Albimonas pacifica]|uniref:Glyoxalase/Bleomycin resistance protein/Dioxygenase superfamily protein n=1 Tax=Albimonas pacifica TaxID=1114924 RepID=A0A1I3MHW2_9RHOB|nr:VOC family protein [Albimonas pacifica]SFI96724.1 Glyoxalase/Bleomycin resistance protein/Dioxygenase superfamily protein [Albimonas pacifica]